MGDCALCMMDFPSYMSTPLMRALDLIVRVCTQGNCRRCIFRLYCVHDHRGVIVLIHITK